MAKPAARVSDSHRCPLSEGPKLHVGATITNHLRLLDQQPVYIGEVLLAATQGDPCLCINSSTPNKIAQGSATVFINDRQAARASDLTMHGGEITSGAENVLIGTFTALAATNVFPPDGQSYGNCGVWCCEQIIHQVWGLEYAEETTLDYTVSAGLACNGYDDAGNYNEGELGAMVSTSMKKLLEQWHVNSDIYNESDPVITTNLLQAALQANKGIIAAVDPELLRKGSSNKKQVDHVVLVTEGDFNKRGELTHAYINDTGDNNMPTQGFRVTSTWLLAAMRETNPTGIDTYELIITRDPIWHQFTPPPSTTHPPFPPIASKNP